jgi:hypothetical protein
MSKVLDTPVQILEKGKLNSSSVSVQEEFLHVKHIFIPLGEVFWTTLCINVGLEKSVFLDVPPGGTFLYLQFFLLYAIV